MMVKRSFFSSLILSFLLLFSPTPILARELVLGGQNVGIELKTNGLLVSGTYKFMAGNMMFDPSSVGLKKGDLIVEVNGSSVTNVNDLMNILSKCEGYKDEISLTVLRDYTTYRLNSVIGRESVSDKWKTGLFVKERVLGVGTITYYDLENNTYGALGHKMGGIDGNEKLFDDGNLYQSEVRGIKKSKNGIPGEKIATINEKEILGSVEINNEYGVYGIIDDDISSYLIMDSASRDEVEEGKAYIYTVVDSNKLEKFEIEIVKLKKQDDIGTKCITFKVTDEKLLSKTNGIVAGMSGSPIVQNKKIVGAVTHVLIDKVNYGYGIYIDFMLEQSGSIK